MKKIYLDFIPSEDEIKVFGWKKDEKGYYYIEYDTPDPKIQWHEYWNQFSKRELHKIMF